MMKLLKTVAVATAVLFSVGPAVALAAPKPPNEGVCSGEKFDVEDLPVTTSDGVIITLVDDGTVHFDLPDGATSATVCVKAGSIKQGNGPEVIVIDEDSDLDHSSGKDLSHVSVIDVVFGESPSPTPSPSPEPEPSETPSPEPEPSEEPPVNTPSDEPPVVKGGNPKLPSTLPKTGIEDVVPFLIAIALLGAVAGGLFWLANRKA